MSKSEVRWVWLWALGIVGLTCLPYLLAWRLAPAGTQYTGLLINPLDGESYYAKMEHGAESNWLFHLTYTPENHGGVFVYTFYLALGKLAALAGTPMPVAYHIARCLAGLFLLLAAYRLISRVFVHPQIRRVAFLLLGLSSGLGWLLAPLGAITADLWVAEGFTFLSILINPHFPLAIGLMLLIFTAILDLRTTDASTPRLIAGAAIASLALALIHPIAVPITFAVLGAFLLLLLWHDWHIPWREAAGVGLAGATAAPLLSYILFASRSNPAMAAWSTQNQTPSLPPWNYAAGYGLILLLALGGIAVAARRRTPADLFLLAWVGCIALLLYVPFALQRRFITGLHVPLTLLATLGLEQIIWPRLQVRRRGLVTGLLVGFTALTNVFVPLVSVVGVAQGRPPLVMTADEAAACAWLHANTTWTDTVLAPTESGQFIPAWAGNRVVYGHPFETIDAKTKEAEVAHFYSPSATAAERRALLDRYGVRYVLIHPPRNDLDPAALSLTPFWTGNDTVLYHVEGAQ